MGKIRNLITYNIKILLVIFVLKHLERYNLLVFYIPFKKVNFSYQIIIKNTKAPCKHCKNYNSALKIICSIII
ncbi:hypothetical protein DAT606_1552 [Melissococcus plutonius]|uniref:Uncharacterized protein n=1 Tax=Melissococcus plutonius TaxID=33970 RepID=A0A2Z5Y4B2_9ENTE|nr:hypothetical protein DAT561_1465 [Melissococcus plutonius]BBD14785.1 hypothetical protein DAT585_0386 [Melissococcus plutonius]BBD17442.1 hypothetical protein DAT606_1552 [Melissococcus plutonius]BBP07998.1 hypothetical protein DAT1033_1552 [Melissococcus plutonius]